uniref:hypothetical protein n=1 Tax=Microbacterium proteolyticum TaxID=1572644 RepID=UPI002417C3E9|nr:hypothetical protein [Microbacterium proteolyticum]
MTTQRQKLYVAKCRCGCGLWAAFKTRRLTIDEHGRYREQGMYRSTWQHAVISAVRWTKGYSLL